MFKKTKPIKEIIDFLSLNFIFLLQTLAATEPSPLCPYCASLFGVARPSLPSVGGRSWLETARSGMHGPPLPCALTPPFFSPPPLLFKLPPPPPYPSPPPPFSPCARSLYLPSPLLNLPLFAMFFVYHWMLWTARAAGVLPFSWRQVLCLFVNCKTFSGRGCSVGSGFGVSSHFKLFSSTLLVT